MVVNFRILIFLAIVAFAACAPKKNNEQDPDKNKAAMMQADRDFSAMSVDKGMKAAFLDYIDSNGILLRPNIVPIAGADAVDYLIAQNDADYTMQWAPKGAAVALSGELGYTYGTYKIQPKTQDTIFYGTYVSIWKKQADGKWKFVLGSENDGIGNIE